ncbi:glycosyltransferase [Rouxiella sp. Mn2063]|uniref:glycosyltransferase n=1 Tax=Rouxiella sp. Mn2063 TaxID=3395262 RepID=UPI003BD40BEC
MRILLIIDGLPGGGAEKVVLTLAEGFLRQGAQVSLFSLRDVCHYDLPAGLNYQVISDNDRSPWRKITELSRRAKQLDRAVRAAGEFDLILSNLHKTDRIVSLSKVLPKEKVWFCLHGMFSSSYLGHRTGFSRWLKQRKIKKVYNKRNIVAVSEAVAKDITEQFALKPANYRVIYNPFDIEAILDAANAPCDLAGHAYIVHVGRLHETKRHDRLIEAYAQSQINAPLVLLGQGKEALTEKLKALAQKLGVEDKVIFKGFQANPYPYIKHASLLVLSSDSEGFGNVLVESLICGTPIVSTACPGGPVEILQKMGMENALAELDSHSLGQKMAEVYQHPPIVNKERLGIYQLDYICKKYIALIDA